MLIRQLENQRPTLRAKCPASLRVLQTFYVPDDHGTCVLCPHFLEYGKFQLDAGYHGAIPIAAQFDLVICLLWARLGPLLAPTLKMPDGSEPCSGTDNE